MVPRSARPWAASRSPIGLPRRWCALRRSLFFQGWPALLPPRLDGGLVALRCPRDRALHAVPHGMQEPTDMGRVRGDAKRASDDLRHPLAGPHLPAEAICLRSAFHEGGQLRELLGAQARLPTGSGLPPQPLPPLPPPPLDPLADAH